jgi:selenocysteine lyase/cysteine desulfurase
LDVRHTSIDFLAADGHKWLLGPEGAGILYVRRELLDLLHPVDIGWNSVIKSRDFSRLDFQLKPHAGRYESGTLNTPGILGLGAGLSMLLAVGVPTIAARLAELTDYLCQQVEKAGWQVYSSRLPAEKSAIVSLTRPGLDPRAVVKQARTAGVIVNHRAGRIRVSPHCYNTLEELDRLIAILQRTSS